MSRKEQKRLEKFKEALENAIYVEDDLQLKTEIKKKSMIVISTDIVLYEKFLHKFPKTKVARKTKDTGDLLTIAGILITVLTGGVLAIVGLPMAGVGVAMEVTGLAMEDYKDYEIYMNYDEKQVMFVKTGGKLSIKMPTHVLPEMDMEAAEKLDCIMLKKA